MDSLGALGLLTVLSGWLALVEFLRVIVGQLAEINEMARREIVSVLRSAFRLDWRGIHGAPHWARVRFSGLQLARVNGARLDVVELFALLHDSQRVHDGGDRHHGARAAQFAMKTNGSLFQLDHQGVELLAHACRYHSDGLTEGDVTIQTCWDADRLDLGRVGIRPHPGRLCTEAAREPDFLAAAYRRSTRQRRR